LILPYDGGKRGRLPSEGGNPEESHQIKRVRGKRLFTSKGYTVKVQKVPTVRRGSEEGIPNRKNDAHCGSSYEKRGNKRDEIHSGPACSDEQQL